MCFYKKSIHCIPLFSFSVTVLRTVLLTSRHNEEITCFKVLGKMSSFYPLDSCRVPAAQVSWTCRTSSPSKEMLGSLSYWGCGWIPSQVSPEGSHLCSSQSPTCPKLSSPPLPLLWVEATKFCSPVLSHQKQTTQLPHSCGLLHTCPCVVTLFMSTADFRSHFCLPSHTVWSDETLLVRLAWEFGSMGSLRTRSQVGELMALSCLLTLQKKFQSANLDLYFKIQI